MNKLAKKMIIVPALIAMQWFSISIPADAQCCGEGVPGYSPPPTAFAIGDEVVVSVDQTRLMLGTDTVTVLNRGQSFKIRDTSGPWLGSVIDRDGQAFKGWVWHSHVSSPGATSAPAVGGTAARPGTERRSFSYEPVYESPAYGSSYEPAYGSRTRSRSSDSGWKPTWKYPKTDPRKYRP